MTKVFESKYLITNISLYLEPNEIISFSTCNRRIKALLDSTNNAVINLVFKEQVTQKFFEMDKDEDFEICDKNNRKNILENSWKSSINWKLYLSQMNKHFAVFANKKISKMVLDSLKVHMYLPDLRKENFYLEFQNSSIHQVFCYDKIFRDTCKSNYYDNYINDNYIANKGKGLSIIILREDYPFQNEIENYITTYEEINSEEGYKNILKKIISYDSEYLREIYEKLEKNGNNNINRIVYFILWLNNVLIEYSNYILDSINKYAESQDRKEFLNEYITQYTNYSNSCLLINSDFDNINIIIHYLNKYILKKNGVEFSLYELALKIFIKNVYSKISSTLLNKTSLLYKKVLEKIIEHKYEEEMEMDEDKTNDSSDDEMCIDDSFEICPKKTDKETLENILNCILDIVINKNNGNGINHSNIILGDEYGRYENMLIENTIEIFQTSLIKEEKSFSEILEILENLFKFENKTKCLKINNSLKIINRTKKNIIQKSSEFLGKIILQNLGKDFSSRLRKDGNQRILLQTYNEVINNKEHKFNLSDISDSKKIKLEGIVGEELNKIKTYLYGQNIRGYGVEETSKLVNQYMDNNGIDFVLFAKKIIYFFYKESLFYDENDQRINNILNRKVYKDDSYSLNEIINDHENKIMPNLMINN